MKHIVGHQGPFKKTDPNYKDCNLQWEDGSITHKPLNIFGHDALENMCRIGQNHNLLDEPGWNSFTISPNQKRNFTYNKCHREEIFCNSLQYMYGVHIPHDTKQALELDEENGNDILKKAINLKVQQLVDYDTFHDEG